MYDNDDLRVIDTADDLESPLDKLEPVDVESEAEKPDPEVMLALLTAPETPQRMLATRAFCELQDERAIPHLINLLKDVCPLVRVSAAYALGRNPSPTAVEPLIEQLNRDWNGYARKGVVWALGNCRDRRGLRPLLDALITDISAVRLWAASSLAQMAKLEYQDMVACIPPLITALKQDPIAAVRSNCAWTLGQLCRELPSNAIYGGAIDGLTEAFAEDEDMGVREDAKAALLRLGDPRALQMIEAIELEGLF
ncbi:MULTISPECIES: HEAT repeat domain-containing protein [unclassified Coleofasciculus]|uniref:HEAT repeat domain-containing protein n=1 Tax=unclassified Coleofasciculus TaxID=2692782 RepID=UPI00187FE80C|nr:MULTISPECIES: HEAT repeat domain-containing protein [unclassified Coleofasciculus]MBE9128110.1 HEAT repeat domain-containing protein [Coleofasciculus sp. LEGE 07081]MBE9152379.1 HEAT repeat domain-containing protein [Coleofasciculus sp. LEGE 07092]